MLKGYSTSASPQYPVKNAPGPPVRMMQRAASIGDVSLPVIARVLTTSHGTLSVNIT
jgi:hypothetical protein